MSYDRADVVCYCDVSKGGEMSVCQKCKEDSLQQSCWFFEKSTRAITCMHLGFGEFCKNTYAMDFANHKHVDEVNIPNINDAGKTSAMGNGGHYIDSPTGPRRIYPTEDGPRRLRFDGIEHDPKIWNIATDECLSDMIKDFKMLQDEQMDHCVVGTPYSIGEARSHCVICDEDLIPRDYSGWLTDEDQNLMWSVPIDLCVTKSYLNDMMQGKCAAYSKKYGLYLDMSNPNLYTIYKSDGHFISLRDLYRDGIYPHDINFIMIDGTPQDELDFEPFLDQVPLMVSSGR